MLETLRRHSRSFLIYVLFGILIAVFIISFGPQAGGGGSGCTPKTAYVVKVGDRDVSETSWRFAYLALGLPTSGARARAARVRETVLDSLIERELLAQAAERAGFRLSDAEVEARIAKGELFILGRRMMYKPPYFQNGAFDYAILERWVRSLGLPSVNYFVAEQRREMLAQEMRDVLAGSVRVSPEEVKERYVQENTKAWLRFVKFEPRKYARSLELSAADIDGYLAKNEAKLQETYDRDKSLYSARGKEIRIRDVLVKRPAPAPTEADTQPAAVPPPQDAAARSKAEAALERLQKGEDFGQVARAVSEDERYARRGGDVGWRPVGALGFGPEFKAAVENLQPGQLSGLIETPRGYHIVKVEGRREGDLSFDNVKRDLAEDALREDKSRELAKADAEAALAKVEAGTPLSEQFESAAPPAGDEPPPSLGLPEGMTLEGLVPEAPVTPPETPTAPATKPEGTAPTAPAPATTPPAGTPPAAPAQHSTRLGDAEIVRVAGQTGDTPKPQAGARTAPSAAPAAGEDRPKLIDSGEVRRNGATLSGPSGEKYIGESAELARAVFEELRPGQVGPKVYDVGDGFVVVELVKRDEPDMEQFKKEEPELASALAFEKAYRITDSWSAGQCEEAKRAGSIIVNRTYSDYGDVDEKTGRPHKTVYEPCMTSQPMMPSGAPIMLGQ